MIMLESLLRTRHKRFQLFQLIEILPRDLQIKKKLDFSDCRIVILNLIISHPYRTAAVSGLLFLRRVRSGKAHCCTAAFILSPSMELIMKSTIRCHDYVGAPPSSTSYKFLVPIYYKFLSMRPR